MFRVPVVLLAALVASGCATSHSHLKSQEYLQLGPHEATKIGELTTERLVTAFPPGKTTFELSPAKTPRAMGFLPSDRYAVFGRALEKSLRNRGFGIAAPDRSFRAAFSEANNPYPKLAYVLDELKEKQAYRIGVAVDSDFRLDGAYGTGPDNFGVVNWTIRNGVGWKQ